TTMQAQLAANWMVESMDRSVKIYGVRAKDGTADAVKTLTITNKLRGGMGQMPTLSAFNGAKVEVITDDGKAKPDPKRKVPPKGRTFPGETFVEFDLSTLPLGADDVIWKMNWEVRTTAGKEEPWIEIPLAVASVNAAENLTFLADDTFPESGFKTELV